MIECLDDFLGKINSGLCNFDDPRVYDFSQKYIDVKLRKTLSKINQSKWCWTLFSCQGHSHKDKSYSLPYFVFIVRNQYKLKFLELILNTLPKSSNLSLPVYNPFSIEISNGFTDENFSIFSVHWSLSFLKKRGKLKELHSQFESLAESILEINHG